MLPCSFIGCDAACAQAPPPPNIRPTKLHQSYSATPHPPTLSLYIYIFINILLTPPSPILFFAVQLEHNVSGYILELGGPWKPVKNCCCILGCFHPPATSLPWDVVNPVSSYDCRVTVYFLPWIVGHGSLQGNWWAAFVIATREMLLRSSLHILVCLHSYV